MVSGRSRKLGLVKSPSALYRRWAPKGGLPVSAQRVDDWQIRAACRGPQSEIFFPPDGFERKADKLQREAAAKAICRTCPVKRPCLDYAVAMKDQNGIWGGLNEAERKSLLLSAS